MDRVNKSLYQEAPLSGTEIRMNMADREILEKDEELEKELHMDKQLEVSKE